MYFVTALASNFVYTTLFICVCCAGISSLPMVVVVLNATFKFASLHNFVIFTYVISGVGECNLFPILFSVLYFIILRMFQLIIQDQDVILLVSII
jgi:hypothetical protein